MLREAHRVHVYHSQREGLSVGQSSSSMFERTARPVGERTARPAKQNSQDAQSWTLLDKQEERILAEYQAEIKKHEFQAFNDKRSVRKFGEIFDSQHEELHCAQAEELQRRDQQLLHAQLLPQNLELRHQSRRRFIHLQWRRVKGQNKNQDLRCQSGPSGRNSVIFSGGDSSKNYGADQQRLQISDLHFDKFPTPATFACWKIRFKTEVCTCSQFPMEAIQWIKEVEMVDSVYDLKSSSSTRGIQMPNFEVLDARIASALNKIIHNSHFKRKVSLKEQKAQKRGPFPSRKTDCLLDLWVLPGHRSQRFCRELCRPVYNWSSKWWYSRIRFKVGRNFIVCDENPTWWHLGRIVQIKNTRVWETQDRIGIVWPGDSSEEGWTWWSQIENDGEKMYRARDPKQELWSQEWKLWKKRRGQKSRDKTACTKNSWRLLAIGVERTVCERRQLQFPPRYE